MIYLLLLSSSLIGYLTANFANKKQKNPYFWFAIGFLFGLMGFLSLYFLSKRPYLQKIRKASNTAPSFPIEEKGNVLWYYLDKENQTQGPMSFSLLSKKWTLEEISPSSYVWNEEMKDWKKIQDLIQ